MKLCQGTVDEYQSLCSHSPSFVFTLVLQSSPSVKCWESFACLLISTLFIAFLLFVDIDTCTIRKGDAVCSVEGVEADLADAQPQLDGDDGTQQFTMFARI